MASENETTNCPTRERCEWHPSEGRWAYSGDDGCANEATVCVGANGLGHVCYECSLHPRFRRMKKSPLPIRRVNAYGRKIEPFEMLNGDEQRHG